MQEEVITADSVSHTLAQARRVAAAHLRAHCPWADEEAVLMVLSELLTNAVRHATGGWRLALAAFPDRLVADVVDHSPRIPQPRPPDLTGGGGMGWHLAERLTTRLDVLPHAEGGKTVRALWTARQQVPQVPQIPQIPQVPQVPQQQSAATRGPAV
ncbi:ATP-binding protein [Kitasatospora sp. NBC_01539]|uniref:ATP-binding protein n=1 Tax=Kitasatospora sp. NBC_01539 TaxID=2903577 RepID=UPI0038600BC4